MVDDFRGIPTPNYEYEISKLVKAYKDAVKSIKAELNSTDISDFARANAMATLSNTARVLKELDGTTEKWVDRNIPKAVRDGVAGSILSLGVVDTLEEAEQIVKFNKPNAKLIEAAVADTQSDLLQVTQNIDRKVKASVRKVAAEVLRANLTQGINGTSTLSREMVAGLRKQLGDAVDTGLLDAAGRRWKPEVYADMLVRTKMLEAHKEATRNEAVDRGANYGVISKHGAKDACSKWESKVVKLTPDAPGDYPYIGDLPRREIFHPNCKHVVSPARRPDRLPKDIRELNNVPEDGNIITNETKRNDTKVGEKPMRELTNEKEIVARGGKVAKGENVLTDIYNGLDDESVEEMIAKEAGAHFKGKYRGAASSLNSLRYEWVEDNLNPGALATENYFSELYDLDYKQKTPKKLTEREMAVIKFAHERTIERFKDAGYTHVKVYRGVTWDEKNSWLPEDTENMTMKYRALTSWTTRKEVAREYADYVDDAELLGSSDTHAGIIETIVPIDQIGFTAIVGETDEVVLVGDVKNANLVAQKRAGRKWR